MATAKAISRNALRLYFRSYSVNVPRAGALWTPDNVVRSPFKDVEIPNTTVVEHVWANLDKWADKTALVCAVTNRSYTYHQLYNQSLNFSANLRSKFQISDEDVVCIMMPNSPEYALASLGILQAGGQMTTINPIYTAYEVQKQLILSNTKTIIASQETIPVIKAAFKLMKREIPVIAVKNVDNNLPIGTVSFHDLAEDDNVDRSILKKVRTKSSGVAILPYSSGTTGLPKGVELTNKNIVINCVQQDTDEIKQYNDTTTSHQDSILGILPFYHLYGLMIVMFHKLTVGAKIVTLPKFQPSSFLTAIKEHKVNLLYVAPPLVLFLGSHPDVKKEHIDSIDKILSGAAPLPKQDIIKALEKTKRNTHLIMMYGLTETSPLVSSSLPGSTSYIASGFALANTELKVVDSDSRTLGSNEVGELWIRGPQVMKGYRNNPEATKECITEDGWFKSGDLAKLDVDGTVIIADRLKELIKVKGYQVPPAELESILKEHPGVLDVGVVGIPDPRTGEAPKAFIVAKDGYKIDAKDIMDFVKDRVAEYKRIKDVLFVDSLPKNPSGKLLRRILKEKYC